MQAKCTGEPYAASCTSRKRCSAVVVVGAALATRLDTPTWRHMASGAQLQVRQVFGDLADAQAYDRRVPGLPGDGLHLVR